jgi:hypothetical protein
MQSNIDVSIGLKNRLLGEESVRDIMRGGQINIYSGLAPSDSNQAVTGTLLVSITRASLTTPQAEVVTVTPVIGAASGANWEVTVNGETVVFTDAGSPTLADVCTGLANILNVLAGSAITTPPGKIQTAKNNGKFVAASTGTAVTITSATAGVPIDVSSQVLPGTGSASGASLTAVITTEDQFGISLEPFSELSETSAGGLIQMADGEVWSGVGLNDGTAGYFRYVAPGDDGTLSYTQPRIQGVVATANAPLIIQNVNIYAGATTTADQFQIQT